MTRHHTTTRRAFRCSPVLIAALLAMGAQAATLTVTSGGDSGAGSLRAAIASAQAGDTIVFAPSVTTVQLDGAELVINRALTVQGAGVTINAGYRSRVLRIAAGSQVRLEGLTLTGGALAGNGGSYTAVSPGGSAEGAGIYNLGYLTLKDVAVLANAAGGGGGGGNIGSGGGGFAGLNVVGHFQAGQGGVGGCTGAITGGGAGGINGGDGGCGGGGHGGTETGPGAGGQGPYAGAGGGAGYGGGGGGGSVYVALAGAGGGMPTNDGVFPASGSVGGGGGRAGGAAGAVAASGGGGGTSVNANPGGHAAGGIFNADQAVLVLLGGTRIRDNVAAGGGRSGGNGSDAGGRGVGALWNAGAVYRGAAVDTSGNLAARGGSSEPAVADTFGADGSVSGWTLEVAVSGSGGVTASGSRTPDVGPEVSCTSVGGVTCAAGYSSTASVARVTLTATAPVGQAFTGWGGACSGADPTCTVTMDQARSVTAAFGVASYSVAGTASPADGGSVSCTPNPAPYGSTSTCTASAASGYAFTGFTPASACSSTSGNDCVLTDVQGPLTVEATFVPVVTTYDGTTVPGGGGTGGDASASFTGGGPNCRFDTSATGFVAGGADAPAGQQFPQGWFKFRLIGCDNSDVTITTTWPQPVGDYIKWGKANGDPAEASTYFRPPGLNIQGNRVSFTIRDGGPGDDDGPGNGTITDPSGPLAAVVPVPTLGQWGLMLLGLLAAGLGGRGLRRHQRGA